MKVTGNDLIRWMVVGTEKSCRVMGSPGASGGGSSPQGHEGTDFPRPHGRECGSCRP